MGVAVDRLRVALSDVKGYARVTHSGKTVQVKPFSTSILKQGAEAAVGKAGSSSPSQATYDAMKTAQAGGPMGDTLTAAHKAFPGHQLAQHFRGDYISSPGSGGAKSNKFYESVVIAHPDGTATHSIAYGSRAPGAHVTTSEKHYPDVESASTAHHAKANAKYNKGYATDQYDQTSRNTNLIGHFQRGVKAFHGAGGGS